MKITIYNETSKDSFLLDVEPTTTIDVVKLKISALKEINYNLIKVFFGNKLLEDHSKSLQQVGINDDDLLTIQIKMNIKKKVQPNNYNIHGEAVNILNNSKNAEYMDNLLNTDEELANYVLRNDLEGIKMIISKRKGIVYQAPVNPNLNFQNLNFQNPNMNFVPNNFIHDDIDNQKKIEEYITKKRLDDLYLETYENYPELLIPTQMLFIEGTINKIPIEIFVDTGAQTTIISQQFAEKADLMQFVDTRHATQIVGVGTQKSVGKIWKVQLEIKGRFFVLTATVLKNFGHDVLLGLDMMKRHHCVIDLSRNVLVFGLEGIYQKFLNDKEVNDLKYKDKDIKVKKVKELLKCDENKALELLEKYNFDPDLTVSIELEKLNKK